MMSPMAVLGSAARDVDASPTPTNSPATLGLGRSSSGGSIVACLSKGSRIDVDFPPRFPAFRSSGYQYDSRKLAKRDSAEWKSTHCTGENDERFSSAAREEVGEG